MTMNRAELVRRLLAHRAAADALEDALKADAREEYEGNGTAASWRMDFATVSASISHDTVEVADVATFHAWLAGRSPSEIETVTVLRVRNPEWRSQLLKGYAAMHDPEQGDVVHDVHGEVVPGLRFVRGGRFVTASVVPARGVKGLLGQAARAYAQGQTEALDLDGVFRLPLASGEGSPA